MSRPSVLVWMLGCPLLVACGSQGAHPSVGTDSGVVDMVTAVDTVVPLDVVPSVDAPMCPPEPVGGPALSAVVSDRLPAADSTGICVDTQLRLTFTTPVAVGTCGKIQVWKANAPDTAVDTIDLAAPNFHDVIGGRPFMQNRPIFIDGMQAIIYLHRSAPLAPNETYFVTIDSGVFVDASKNPLGSMKGPTDWTFSTRAPVSPSPDNLVVSLDGTADFCSVQGAVDFVPPANTAPVTITVKNGTYREIVFVSRKNNITLHGEDRTNTVIAYANNNNLQASGGGTGGTGNRAMVEVENSNGFVAENITLHNLTPQGGSQAEVIRVETGDQTILRNSNFISLQDTLLLSGRAYVTHSYVEGNVDFIWGKGIVYFDNSEIKTVGRAGYNVQSRNPTNTYGYVFVDSQLTSSPGLTGHMLARIDGSVYPGSHVAYINCQMGSHISPAGWTITFTVPTATDTSGIRFWEYQSTDAAGAPIDVSLRLAASRQITEAEAAMMRDKAVVFGLPAWNPAP